MRSMPFRTFKSSTSTEAGSAGVDAQHLLNICTIMGYFLPRSQVVKSG